MPDLLLILEAFAAAALVAAGGLLLCGGRWGGAASLAVGFFAGVWVLGVRPRFPPREDQDRWLLVLLPAAVAVENAAAALARLPRLAWSLRLALAAAAAPILLYGSSYVADLSGPGSREWTQGKAGLILGGLAASLAAVWILLDRLARRSARGAVPLALALAAAGGGVVVLLSGYSSGGQLGFPLAAGLAGAAAASFFLRGNPDLRGVLGVGIVGLFALLVVGRFFGKLTTTNAVLLFAAPLLAWLPELPFLGRIGPRRRAFAGWSLTGLPVALALVLAWQKFQADSARPSTPSGTPQPSVQDYLDFGK
jgi:hypothetical protein